MNDRRLASVAKALASETRCRMLREIAAAGEMTCTDVCGRFRLSQATISHHLKTLEQAGLIRVRKDGLFHRVSADPVAVAAFARALEDAAGPADAARRGA